MTCYKFKNMFKDINNKANWKTREQETRQEQETGTKI